MNSTYCVKERRKTSNVKGTEMIGLTKNGRKILRVKLAMPSHVEGEELPATFL